MDKNTNRLKYKTIQDIIDDMTLIRDNTHKYNTGMFVGLYVLLNY